MYPLPQLCDSRRFWGENKQREREGFVLIYIKIICGWVNGMESRSEEVTVD